MRIEVFKDKETSLVIDDIGTIIAEEGMLKEGYLKALQALARYVKQASSVRKRLSDCEQSSSQINDILYQSPQNIIAFSGKRGTGKTSAMISFSEFLKKGAANTGNSKNEFDEYCANMHNLVLSPIDPTMLENDQNILNIVLSRLIYKAEERWEDNSSFIGSTQNLQKEKNELLRKANDCMNGIIAMKNKSEIKSLADIQHVGDSAVLKKNLYDLVNMVNSFCLGKNKANSESCYLIIPIDDTDCQILKAHDVMEDIRRYLTIPNIVILMATDADLLRTVFAQHYAKALDESIKLQFLTSNYVGRYAEKYLTKLIPVTNRVYLPVFEKVMKDKPASLELGYYGEDKNIDLISKTDRGERDKYRAEGIENHIDFNFQAKVLQLIYKRTGLVFFEHRMYINNIIPTTMRGLTHLLNFLDSMEEVKDVDYSRKYTSEEFKGMLTERLDRLEKNLDLFEEYFLNEWIPAKVSGHMIDILREVEAQVPENMIQYAFDETVKYYNDKHFEKNHGPMIWNDDMPLLKTYYDLMDLLGDLNDIYNVWATASFKSTEDYYNISAIRTLILIKNNKLAIRLRRDSLDSSDIKSIKYSEDELSHLILPVFESNDEEKGNTAGPNKKIVKEIVEQYLVFLQKEDYQDQSDMRSYCMHELSWAVLCNWDVQDAIYKSFKEYVYKHSKDRDKTEMWNAIQQSIKEKNCNMLASIVNEAKIEIVSEENPDEKTKNVQLNEKIDMVAQMEFNDIKEYNPKRRTIKD